MEFTLLGSKQDTNLSLIGERHVRCILVSWSDGPKVTLVMTDKVIITGTTTTRVAML